MFVYLLIVCTFWNIESSSGHNLIAYISQHGLHGEIKFRQLNASHVEIKTDLETTLQYPDQVWSWTVRKLPVDYTNTDTNERCDLNKLGPEVLRFEDELDYLILPGNETSTWLKEMSLIGEHGIWGKSLLLIEVSRNARVCASITTIQASAEHKAEARFHSPISGSIYFRWLAPTGTLPGDTIIYADLYHIQEKQLSLDPSKPFTKHNWKIFVTDILKNDHHRNEDNCNFLQLIFDPTGNGTGKGIGDLDVRLGKILIAKNALHSPSRALYRDDHLFLLPSDLTIPHRTLYLVIYDEEHSDNYLACTKIRHIKPLYFKSIINYSGINGEITFTQRTKFDPTFLNFSINAANENNTHLGVKFAEDVSSFQIHTLPPLPQKKGSKDYCFTTGVLHNSREIDIHKTPPPGFGTQDQYALGDLSGKLQSRNKQYYHSYQLPGRSSELNGLYWDIFLPLQGLDSIAHRSVVIYHYNRTNPENITETPWHCGPINQYDVNGIYQKTIFTAQVLFRYPIVGRVLFRQPADEPWQDTTIIFEYLIHADGSSQSNTFDHRWAVHSKGPGKDFYDWQNRCMSTGDVYNPYRAQWDRGILDDFCTSKISAMCPMGALWLRTGSLTIAGSLAQSQALSRRIFTDSNLSLSGRHNILGKSLVIYDDFGPKARGERLACSLINGYYRRKVVAKEWFANGDTAKVRGKVEIIQQTEYDVSNVKVQFKGLNKNSGYHIHMTPVEDNLAFPCENSSLYGHFNPFKVNPKLSPPSSFGSTDQYELGDLSGKFGTLDSFTYYEGAFNDTNLPLFGLNSIIGRSVVIHKKRRNARWACSTLERGYAPSEAREVYAIASFHHPTGYAYGYIKMSQLIHNDGSQSDTVIEVKLRHPGKHDRNVTRNHNWQIFVNGVGVDAVVKPTITRCVAGGYVWNPYYTQLADPLNRNLYERECGPDNPLRCYVGDLGARLGPLSILNRWISFKLELNQGNKSISILALGAERTVLTDSNLPLEGPLGAMGRSIVIFGADYSSDKFACANIEPDHNVIKYINLQKPPRFVIAQFIEELRSVMGIPEWMLDVDARQTKELHGGACIQMIIHFRGPIAHRLELDMSRLIAAGRLDSPSLYIPGYINKRRKATISYRTCGVRDPNEKRMKFSKSNIANGCQRQYYSFSTNFLSALCLFVCLLVFVNKV